jgi:hypothetical protein
VTIEPHDDVWLVSLNTDDLSKVVMNTYLEIPDALESVHERMLMLTDETEITPDPALANSMLRESLARLSLREEVRPPETVDETRLRDEMRAWFEREMGPGIAHMTSDVIGKMMSRIHQQSAET